MAYDFRVRRQVPDRSGELGLLQAMASIPSRKQQFIQQGLQPVTESIHSGVEAFQRARQEQEVKAQIQSLASDPDLGRFLPLIQANPQLAGQLLPTLFRAQAEKEAVARPPSRGRQYVGVNPNNPNAGVVFDPGEGTFADVPFPGSTQPGPRNAGRLPAEQVDKEAGFDALQSQIENVKSKYSSSFVGPVASRFATLAQYFEATADPIAAEFLADVESIRNQIIYLRSGKQINEAEAERLLRELPNEKTSPTVFLARLELFDKNIRNLRAARSSRFKESGYMFPDAPRRPNSTPPAAAPGQRTAPGPQAVTGAPAPGTIKKGYRFKGGNPADKNNWEKVR